MKKRFEVFKISHSILSDIENLWNTAYEEGYRFVTNIGETYLVFEKQEEKTEPQTEARRLEIAD